MTSLVKKIDKAVEQAAPKHTAGQKLGTFVIIGSTEGRDEQLRGIATKESLKHLALCIGVAPPRYEVNPDADVTVVIYTVGRPGRQEVVANFALRQCELDEAKTAAIVEALAKVLPK
ncbi:MAG: hypothetical protein K8U57_20535 [Planctomycetes bacterium]|nr:hypothetical protein [Planctomycetota bacterium]